MRNNSFGWADMSTQQFPPARPGTYTWRVGEADPPLVEAHSTQTNDATWPYRVRRPVFCVLCAVCCVLITGCATPQYAVYPIPVPDESAPVTELEHAISAYQAKEFARQGARLIQPGERLFGFDVPRIVTTLSQVTERPSLSYRVFLLTEQDPNAAALADGRTYVTTGMLNYLAARGSRESELAAVLAHELAHTAAQHLVKRYQQLQQHQAMLALVELGTTIATKDGSSHAKQTGAIVSDVATLISDVVAAGYSQEQELEADQLGVRYMIRAGYDPSAAIAVLKDFERFEQSGPFLRTHPYSQRRVEDLERYLSEVRAKAQRLVPPASPSREEARRRLLESQRLYPIGSTSWKNIQQQLDELDQR